MSHVTYLHDRSTEVEGLVVYGSPWTVERRWSPAYAFTTPSGTLRSKHWRLIPDKVDVLVTHSPPKNILDNHGVCGCAELREEVFGRIKYKRIYCA